MQFFTWMKRNYIDDPTVKGTLARSMKDDSFSSLSNVDMTISGNISFAVKRVILA